MNSESQPKVNFLPTVKWVEKVLQLLSEHPRPSQNARYFETFLTFSLFLLLKLQNGDK